MLKLAIRLMNVIQSASFAAMVTIAPDDRNSKYPSTK